MTAQPTDDERACGRRAARTAETGWDGGGARPQRDLAAVAQRPRTAGPAAPGAARAPGRGGLDQRGRPQLRRASASRCRRPRRTASRPSTRCSRPNRSRRPWSTSATTSPAGSSGGQELLRRAASGRRAGDRDGDARGAEPVPRRVRAAPGGPGPAAANRRGPGRSAAATPRRPSAAAVRPTRRHACAGPSRAPQPAPRRPRGPPAAPPGRRGRPDVARRVPRAGRLRGAAARHRARPGRSIREVKDAKLLGRGGAAFPTGVKWEAVAEQPARPHYFVCNADESEPGTFKDRVVMELDPFAVIEALTIAGFATGAERGYLYVRGEYPLATNGCTSAIAEARARAAWATTSWARGSRSTSSSGAAPARTSAARRRRCSTRSRASAANRGTSRRSRSTRAVRQAHRDQQRGDADQRARDPHDRRAAYAKIGTEDSTGTRLFCLSGHVERPGCTRSHSARRSASCSTWPAGCAAAAAAGGAARRGGRRVRRAG